MSLNIHLTDRDVITPRCNVAIKYSGRQASKSCIKARSHRRSCHEAQQQAKQDIREPFGPLAFRSETMLTGTAVSLRLGETYTVSVPGEQYWTDGRIRSDANGYHLHYDAIDACWVRSLRRLQKKVLLCEWRGATRCVVPHEVRPVVNEGKDYC